MIGAAGEFGAPVVCSLVRERVDQVDRGGAEMLAPFVERSESGFGGVGAAEEFQAGVVERLQAELEAVDAYGC